MWCGVVWCGVVCVECREVWSGGYGVVWYCVVVWCSVV